MNSITDPRLYSPTVTRPQPARIHGLAHRTLGCRQDDGVPPRRCGARTPGSPRRGSRRRCRAHAPLEGPRLLEGRSRHEHRADRLGRVPACAPRGRGRRGRRLSLRRRPPAGARDDGGIRAVRRGLRPRLVERVRATRSQGPVRPCPRRRPAGLHRRHGAVRGANRSRSPARHRARGRRGVGRLT